MTEWVLGNSARAASALNCSAASLAPFYLFLRSLTMLFKSQTALLERSLPSEGLRITLAWSPVFKVEVGTIN